MQCFMIVICIILADIIDWVNEFHEFILFNENSHCIEAVPIPYH